MARVGGVEPARLAGRTQGDVVDLELRQMAAWETYCAGRLARLGLHVNQQRWLYNFRNRHGFTDTADAGFHQLWAADGLTWGEVDAISTAATVRS